VNWHSTQQVGCATTDQNGTFEIRFHRLLRLVAMVNSVSAAPLGRSSRLRQKLILPAQAPVCAHGAADPAPDFSLFQALLHAGDRAPPALGRLVPPAH
jgi:hypothetical protein